MSHHASTIAAAALAWFGEQGEERVKSEIGRVKSSGAFSISIFTIHSSPSLAIVGDALLPRLLSGDCTCQPIKEIT